MTQRGSPPGDSYETFEITCKGIFGCYKDAREQLRTSEYTSDLNPEKELPPKRIRRIRVIDSDDEDTFPPIPDSLLKLAGSHNAGGQLAKRSEAEYRAERAEVPRTDTRCRSSTSVQEGHLVEPYQDSSPYQQPSELSCSAPDSRSGREPTPRSRLQGLNRHGTSLQSTAAPLLRSSYPSPSTSFRGDVDVPTSPLSQMSDPDATDDSHLSSRGTTRSHLGPVSGKLKFENDVRFCAGSFMCTLYYVGTMQHTSNSQEPVMPKSEFQRQVLKNPLILRLGQQQQSDLLANLPSRSALAFPDSPILIPEPFQTVEQLEGFENKVTKDNEKQLVQELCILGGSSLKTCVKRIMCHIMTDK
ncbi:uncharacterized protein LOC135388496 isoform X2 [Ornithodoros turicata]|uniref:uncharacterized protein LOC135388496 isoform X2 n=1 Tax=Ornithodoros turicata TaxID=34597 RepID=UPI0031398DF4